MAVQQDIAPRARSPEGGHRAPLGLVLTGGGARAAYQVGALAAIAEAVPDLAFPIVTGVSAGAINAAFLAAHPGPFAPAIAALRAAALSATSYATGETVTFVHGAPDVPVWRRALRHAVRARLTVDHVLASAALPLAPAIHLGAQALVVVTNRGPAAARDARPASYPSVAEIGQLVLHAIFLDALEADIERLERLNRLLASFPAGVTPPEGLRRVGLLWLRPSRDLGALAAGRHARLPPLVRFLVRRAGGHRAGAVDFLSYVLFDPAYTAALMDLGYDDARRDWPRLERFFAAAAP